MKWLLKQSCLVLLVVVLMVSWNAPGLTSLGFWVGVVALALMDATNDWRV